MSLILSNSIPIILGLIFSFLSTTFIARMVGPATFGEYTFALTWISVSALLSKAGHEWVLLKIIPGRLHAGALGQIKYLLRKTFIAVLSRSIVAATILGYLAFLMGYWKNLNDMVLGLALVIVMALAELRRTWALAHRAVWLSDAPENIIKSLVLSVCVFTIIKSGMDADTNTLLALNLTITTITATIATAFFLLIKAPGILNAPYESLSPEISSTNDLVKTMWFATAVNISMRNLDIVVVGMLTDVSTTGLYAAASRIGQLAAAPVMILDRLVTPELAVASEKNDKEILYKISHRYVLVASSTSLSVFIGFLLSGNFMINILLGSKYESSYFIGLIFLAGNLGVALAGPANTLMSLSGRHRQSTFISTIAAILHIFLVLLLTNLYGAVGAATACAATICSKAWVSTIWLRITMRIDTSLISFLQKK